MNINYEGFIPLLAGLYVFLCASDRISLSKDPIKNKEWLFKYGRLMRWIGPLCMIFGCIQLAGFLNG